MDKYTFRQYVDGLVKANKAALLNEDSGQTMTEEGVLCDPIPKKYPLSYAKAYMIRNTPGETPLKAACIFAMNSWAKKFGTTVNHAIDIMASRELHYRAIKDFILLAMEQGMEVIVARKEDWQWKEQYYIDTYARGNYPKTEFIKVKNARDIELITQKEYHDNMAALQKENEADDDIMAVKRSHWLEENNLKLYCGWD